MGEKWNASLFSSITADWSFSVCILCSLVFQRRIFQNTRHLIRTLNWHTARPFNSMSCHCWLLLLFSRECFYSPIFFDVCVSSLPSTKLKRLQIKERTPKLFEETLLAQKAQNNEKAVRMRTENLPNTNVKGNATWKREAALLFTMLFLLSFFSCSDEAFVRCVWNWLCAFFSHWLPNKF